MMNEERVNEKKRLRQLLSVSCHPLLPDVPLPLAAILAASLRVV